MLAHFLAVALSFPCVVYTVLLGISIVYWLFVMVGAVHLDGGDGAVDGALDGAADGAAEGAAHAHADGGDFGDGGDGGDLGDGGHAHHGALAGMMASLKLRSAPATLVLSVIVLFSWLFSIFGMQAAAAWLPSGTMMSLARFAVLLLAPVLALPFTSLVVRPLARIFVPPHAAKHESLVGKVATVRTGTVTDRFGEALLEDGGAGLVVRVRVDTGEQLKRGDQVVIVSYDGDRQEFTVAPMENLLDEREEEDVGARARARLKKHSR